MANLTKYREGYDSYILDSDEIAVGSNKSFLDLFNAVNSREIVIIHAIYVLPKTDVAVTGAVSARMDVYRTSTVGTGGTTASYKAVQPNVPNINPFDQTQPALPAQITARTAPSGGAAISSWVTKKYVAVEETVSSSQSVQEDNLLHDLPDVAPLVLREGEGILIKQGSVASVSSLAIQVIFSLADAK